MFTAEDLVAAFGDHTPTRVHIHQVDAPSNLDASLEVRAFLMDDDDYDPWNTPGENEDVFLPKYVE